MSTSFDYSIIFESIRNGSCDEVKRRCAHPNFNVNWQDPQGCTLLIRASHCGHVAIIQHLLTIPGVNVNLANREGMAPIHWACHKGHSQVVAELLRHPEVDLKTPSVESITPMQYAVRAGNVKIVNLIHDHEMGLGFNTNHTKDTQRSGGPLPTSEPGVSQERPSTRQKIAHGQSVAAEMAPETSKPPSPPHRKVIPIRPIRSTTPTNYVLATDAASCTETSEDMEISTVITATRAESPLRTPCAMNPCLRHPNKEMYVFCHTCCRQICLECLPEEHSEHRFTYLKKKVAVMAAEVREFESTIRDAAKGTREAVAAWKEREQEYKAAREGIEVQFAALYAEVKRVETQWLQKVDQQHEIIVSKEEAAREVATRLTTFTFSAAGLETQRSFEDKLKYCENAKKAAATLQSLRIPSPPSASL